MKMWICRRYDGYLSLHLKRPRYSEVACEWLSGALLTKKIDVSEYPEVTFENSPMEVELVIKK